VFGGDEKVKGKLWMSIVAAAALLIAGLMGVFRLSGQEIPGTSVVTGYVTDWWTGNPIEGSLVRVINESSGAEVGNCTTGADGLYVIKVDFTSVGMTMTANITASKEGYHTNYTITTLTGKLPPETKTINFTLKEAIPPNVLFVYPTPENNTEVNTSFVFINATVIENETDIGGVWLVWDSEKVEMENRTGLTSGIKYLYATGNASGGVITYYCYNKTGLTDGVYEYTVYAEDLAGNIGKSETRFVRVKLPAPPKISLNCTLVKGWNFISVPLNVSNWSVPAVLSSIEGKYTMIWTYNASTESSQIYMPGVIEDFKELEPGRAYLIQMSEDATLEIEGTLLKQNISLLKGWNTFGVPYGLENYSLPDILDEHGLKNKYTMIWTYNASTESSQIYMPPYIEDFKELEPCNGYFIRMEENAMWEWE